jgi:hypothetical protein
MSFLVEIEIGYLESFCPLRKQTEVFPFLQLVFLCFFGYRTAYIIGGSQSVERMDLEKAIIKTLKQCANDPSMPDDSSDTQEFKKLSNSLNIINIT